MRFTLVVSEYKYHISFPSNFTFYKWCVTKVAHCTLTFVGSLGRWRCIKPRTTDLVVIEGHLISQLYMDEMLRSVVLPFCAKTSDSTRPKMTMLEHTSQKSAKTMLCALTGQFVHQTYLHFNMSMKFSDRGPNA